LPAQGVVWALLDAGRGEIYAARYTPYSEADTRLWGPSKPPDIQVGVEDPVEARYYVLTPARLAELLARDGQAGLAPALCGEWRAETYVALEAALTELGVRARIDDTPRRAWSLAELALMRLATQREALASVEALAALEPSYLRRPAITTSTKRALGQSNQSGQREQEPEQDYEEGATHAVRG
ncbi:MAG TPA: hypothetical protein VKQ36_11860, partial [Ktedonobacterales bacterium]|nr:hypothetical protein [Ktedonobacterales bacterium]